MTAGVSAVATKRARLRLIIMGAGLAVAALVVFSPAFHGAFLWDDNAHVTRPDLRSPYGLWRIWSEAGATQQYYPILHSAFWFEHRLWGDAAFGYHLANVSLHILASWLLVAVLRSLGMPGAWLAGALFVLHPVTVESVAWISEQKNTLSTVFYLAAMWCYLRFDERRTWSWYAAACGLFSLALLTKSVTATLPAALLVLFWWKRGRLTWRGDVLPLVPWFLLGASVGLVTASVERALFTTNEVALKLSLLERCLLAGRALWFYLGKLCWPSNLVFIYPRWHLRVTDWWQWLFPVGALTLVAICWTLQRRTRTPLAVCLLFAGTLFPALGFFDVFPFLYSYVADHFQYLASLAVFAAAGAVMTRLTNCRPLLANRSLTAACAVALICLGVLSWRQSRIYRDSATLFQDTIFRNPGCWMACNNLGVECMIRGKHEEAIAYFRRSLQIFPDNADAHNNLALELASRPAGLAEAIVHYEEAVRLKPGYVEAHYNLANALRRVPGREHEAGVHYRATVLLRPSFVEAHLVFAAWLCASSDGLVEGIRHYEQAVRLMPNHADIHFALANALATAPDRLVEAAAHYNEALRLRPEFAEAHNNLALVCYRLKEFTNAIAHLEMALKLNPNYGDARRNREIILGALPK